MSKKDVIGFDSVEKVVKPSGNTCRVLLTKKWEGKRVLVILLDPL